MTILFNKRVLKDRRRELRRNLTDAERLLWQKLRNKQLCCFKFYRQYSVGLYILDFYCPKRKLAIELDGGQHAENENREYDKSRTDFMKLKGIEVIRFWNNDVLNNLDGVLEKIAEKITPPNLPFAKGEEY